MALCLALQRSMPKLSTLTVDCFDLHAEVMGAMKRFAP
jgi:hypothetical protein